MKIANNEKWNDVSPTMILEIQKQSIICIKYCFSVQLQSLRG